MQTETRLSILKIYRQGDPLTCQRIWDVIKDLKIERKLTPTKENIVHEYCRKHNVEGKYVKEQIRFLTEDKLILLKSIAGGKGNKKDTQNIYVIPLESEIDVAQENDWYCFQCHKPGEVLNCISCPRVYHVKCLKNFEGQKTEAFICQFCKDGKPDPNVNEDLDVRRELNNLIHYACARLEEQLPLQQYVWVQKALNNNAVTPHTTDRCAARLSKITKELVNSSVEEEKWRAKFLLRLPIDKKRKTTKQLTVSELISKADRQVYESLNQFYLDSLTIVHNISVFYGENDILADAARAMLRKCAFEIGEMNLCRDCYKRSNEPEGPDWFCLPCKPPHELVYAKAKGFPFWPAKVLRKKDDQCDVRFFGHGHDRLTLNKIHTRPIDLIKAPPKKSPAWLKAVEELKKHQKMLAEEAISSNENSNDDMDSQDENNASTPEKSKPFNLDTFCTVSLNRLNYQSLIKKIDCKRLEPIISGSELPFTEESVISQNESTDHAMLDLAIIQDNPIFPEPEAIERFETETSEKVMMDFPCSVESNDSNIELLSAKEMIAALERTILSKNREISAQQEEIKSLHKSRQQEIETLNKSKKQEIECLQESKKQEIETLQESKKQEIETLQESKKQEIETLQENYLTKIESLIANHKKEMDNAKTKIWCYNQCGQEGMFYCCLNVNYCGRVCQTEHWKKTHKKNCKREREMQSKQVKDDEAKK